MQFSSVLFAFGLTLFAGLSTGIGSAVAFLSKRMDARFLSGSLGFSAGVMIYVSMIEIFVKARDSLTADLGESIGYWYTTLAFFGGMAIIALIDKLVPSPENPHHGLSVEDMELVDVVDKSELMRMGLFSALAIAIHNFPEGIATFVSALQDPALGVSIAIAIAIHNIPEGIAVSVPIYYATKDRKRAFLYSVLSGLSEPVGAIFGYVVIYRYISGVVFGLLFASVAGIMVFISLDELLPTAEKYGEHHIAIYGVVTGMITMAVSLLLFT
jgi:ZIP family zinc transporter